MHTFIVHRYGESLLWADISCTFITADISPLFVMYLYINIILLHLLSFILLHACGPAMSSFLGSCSSAPVFYSPVSPIFFSLRVVAATLPPARLHLVCPDVVLQLSCAFTSTYLHNIYVLFISFLLSIPGKKDDIYHLLRLIFYPYRSFSLPIQIRQR
jgi:hypothetical protein